MPEVWKDQGKREVAGRLPDWLGQILLTGGLPWDSGNEVSAELLLNRLDLGGARWLATLYDVHRDGRMILAVQVSPGANSTAWPILFIRIDGVKQLTNSTSAAPETYPRPILSIQVEQVAGEQMLVVTACDGGTMELIYDGVTVFLLLAPDATPLELATGIPG
jgi:hypothetical protein